MATGVRHGETREAGYHPWVAAVVAGLAAGAAMGAVLSVGTNLLPLVGALYGMESYLGGWVAHLANSVVFALLFAAILSRPVVRRESFALSTYVGIGVGYGAFLGIVTGGVLFPLWLNAGIDAGLPLPFVPATGVDAFGATLVMGFAHLVYGAVLGPVYALASRSVPGVSL
ncbi:MULTISPECIES: hypothetical protein [Halorussus]|uniref:hypothetical protein n=1 Tax=Halorussus TaxID=1070314 RepID=UPI00209DD872|nr:hypothetical protein [Halorussus vallis]USZ78126.1 hypothetical protein NGM07_20930 [Halorussus vallis]